MANFSKPQGMLSVLVALFALLQFTVAFQHGAHQHLHRNADAIMQAQIEEVADALEKRQAGGRVATVGVCASGSQSNDACNSSGRSSVARIEIRELAKQGELWNLYLLAMERFQAKDKTDTLSYYQIAGIHGRPFTTWNKATTINAAGYCPHSNSLFGSWHRPFLSVFEQGLYQAALEVVNTFPANDQQRLKDLAATLRLPYWDWAEGDGVPSVISDQTVTVKKASGSVTIPNPLYSYSWGSQLPAEMGGGPGDTPVPRTLRRPRNNVSNDRELNSAIKSLQQSLRERVFSLFASGTSWGDASTSAIGIKTSNGNRDSFESLHDVIHATVGGDDGHMSWLEYAAFDPVFWLHHCNIDRLLAMYQLMVPNTWVSDGTINHPMAQWNQGEAKTSSSGLIPFLKDGSNYYTSNDVKETRLLGYHYPETEQRTRDQVVAKINQYRGTNQALPGGDTGNVKTTSRSSSQTSSKTSSQSSGKSTAAPSSSKSSGHKPSQSSPHSPSQTSGQSTIDKGTDNTAQSPGRPFKDGEYHTVFEIIANKFAMKGSYTVHCFVGKQTGNKNSTSTAPFSNSTSSHNEGGSYFEHPHYVGSYGVLGGHMVSSSGNNSYPVMTSGSLPLTSCLQGKVDKGELKSLTPEHIEPYLKENMYYKVVGPKGEINPETIPDFHVGVKCTEAKPAKNEYELPDLSAPYKKLPECTKEKPAGKPFTYTPSPIDVPPLSPGSIQVIGSLPYPVLPWEEPGYCAAKQVIHYVDPKGNFLYAES